MLLSESIVINKIMSQLTIKFDYIYYNLMCVTYSRKKVLAIAKARAYIGNEIV